GRAASRGLVARRRVFSGIQPTGKLHLGNYIGAISLWVATQAEHEAIFCIADLHALTIPEAARAAHLRAKVRETAAVLVACGIDPARAILFVQSHVPAHTQLAWLLSCVTPIGLVDPPDAIRDAVMHAVTDSGREVRPERPSPGVTNLLRIYELLSGRRSEAVQLEFMGKGYAVLKRAVADLVVTTLEPIRRRY